MNSLLYTEVPFEKIISTELYDEIGGLKIYLVGEKVKFNSDRYIKMIDGTPYILNNSDIVPDPKNLINGVNLLLLLETPRGMFRLTETYLDKVKEFNKHKEDDSELLTLKLEIKNKMDFSTRSQITKTIVLDLVNYKEGMKFDSEFFKLIENNINNLIKTNIEGHLDKSEYIDLYSIQVESYFSWGVDWCITNYVKEIMKSDYSELMNSGMIER